MSSTRVSVLLICLSTSLQAWLSVLKKKEMQTLFVVHNDAQWLFDITDVNPTVTSFSTVFPSRSLCLLYSLNRLPSSSKLLLIKRVNTLNHKNFIFHSDHHLDSPSEILFYPTGLWFCNRNKFSYIWNPEFPHCHAATESPCMHLRKWKQFQPSILATSIEFSFNNSFVSPCWLTSYSNCKMENSRCMFELKTFRWGVYFVFLKVIFTQQVDVVTQHVRSSVAVHNMESCGKLDGTSGSLICFDTIAITLKGSDLYGCSVCSGLLGFK